MKFSNSTVEIAEMKLGVLKILKIDKSTKFGRKSMKNPINAAPIAYVRKSKKRGEGKEGN